MAMTIFMESIPAWARLFGDAARAVRWAARGKGCFPCKAEPQESIAVPSGKTAPSALIRLRSFFASLGWELAVSRAAQTRARFA
jgi:hypothetical protein